MTGTAAVIGSGPNGLAAAVRLAQAGLRVTVYEADSIVGGGASTAELTLPGFRHDRGSAIHPMALSSPFFRSLRLENYGLQWIFPPAPLAHPFDDGSALTLERDIEATTSALNSDGEPYRRLVQPLVRQWPVMMREVLGPLPRPTLHPLMLAQFGIRAFQPAALLGHTLFESPRTRALFAGLAAHSILRLQQPLSSAFAMILCGSAHAVGWPIPQGGSQAIIDALQKILDAYGGAVRTGVRVKDLGETAGADIVLCDVTPRGFLQLAGSRLPSHFARALSRFRYGPGVFKVDWALREPIPWKSPECRRAGTVHLGATTGEISRSEQMMFGPTPSPNPFVILAQPSLFDGTRAPAGSHTAWAYAHVPNGWLHSHLDAIESQIERFAPGFRDCVLARHTASPADLERRNSNLVGGDLNGGLADVRQFLLRPTWRHYDTPLRNVFLCSSSTPPGGGVHGMCGYHAAGRALRFFRRARRKHFPPADYDHARQRKQRQSSPQSDDCRPVNSGDPI